jgi:hypothetical protein
MVILQWPSGCSMLALQWLDMSEKRLQLVIFTYNRNCLGRLSYFNKQLFHLWRLAVLKQEYLNKIS